MIKDIRGALVPMKFLPLQVKYQEAMFGAGWRPGEPRDGTWVKARKATVSSWAAAVETACFLVVPGFDVAVIANNEKTLGPLSLMVNTFYDNMPEHARPPKYRQIWGTEQRQVVFEDPGTKRTIINTMVMSSSNSPNFGRGFTIRIVHLDEYAFFESGFDADALQNSVGGNAIYFRISTANGQDRHFYPSVLAAKRKAVHSQVYIFYPWWENPENWYGEEDDNRRSADWGKILPPGVILGSPAEEEMARGEVLIAPKLPDRPGMSRERAVSGYLAFRRRKLMDALKDKANDPRAAQGAFFQEYPEDDIRPFQNLENPIFDLFMLDAQVMEAEKGLALPVEGIPQSRGGMAFRAWRRPIPGHSYAGGQDYSAMKGRDAATLQVKDLSTGEYMAELYGNQGNSVPDVTSYACQVLSVYNHGLFIPEINNMGRTQGNFARYDLGYPNVYRRPRRPGESLDSPSYRAREYGFETTEGSRRDMIVAGQGHFNAGRLRILNADLGRDMQAWNPEQEREGVDGTKKHFPDRLSGFFLVEVVDPLPEKSTLYGALGDGGHKRVGQTSGRGGTAPRPFPLRV